MPACAFPIVERRREMARLAELHAHGRHTLILGAAGVGKSALVGQLQEQLSLLVSARSARLGEICEGLESQLGLEGAGLKLLQRKKRVREAVAAAGRTVVFDGVGRTGPKLSSFMESAMERAPVWMCARSEHPWDIGHFWPLLARFERVEVRPFHLRDTQALVEAAVAAGCIPAKAMGIVEWLQRRSGGIPRVLHELVEELASGRYDPDRAFDLKLLDLDRRIHQAVPGASAGPARPPQRPE